jgi:hypothetical protein
MDGASVERPLRTVGTRERRMCASRHMPKVRFWGLQAALF